MFFKRQHFNIPADVPCRSIDTFVQNMSAITFNTDRLLLFAVDQKLEHLNTDFYGQDIHADAADPENIFIKARASNVGALAVHAGLLSRYAKKYQSINYIVKLNGKTNLLNQEYADPMSTQLWTVQDALCLAKRGVPIRGIGYTVYLGSTFEHIMLQQAAQAVVEAHKHGLVAIVWVYPRGKSVDDVHAPTIIAGAAGAGLVLGADFVKIHALHDSSQLMLATQAAGNTKVICAGGNSTDVLTLLKTIHNQLTHGNTAGAAVGRNLISRSVPEATALGQALHALIYKNISVEAAHALYTDMLNKRRS